MSQVPFAVYWKLRLVELLIYSIVLLVVFVLSFLPLSKSGWYKTLVQVIVGLALSFSICALLGAAQRTGVEGVEGVVLVTFPFFWPADSQNEIQLRPRQQ
tara:strand:- start:227 stop:526 length:300 start_codon:yes stop_codon:yes gene_type:complete